MDETLVLPPIRGRDADLALIGQRLEDVSAGRGGVMLVEGAPGFGKTRVLLETAHRAARLAIRCGHGLADPLDQIVDLAPVLEALFDTDPPLLNKKELNVVRAASQ